MTDPTPALPPGIPLDGYVLVKQDDLAPRCRDGIPPVTPQDAQDPPEPLLTVRQAAQQLSLSPSAVHNYISSHRLPAIRLGRAVRIQPADLAEFIAQHRQNGKDPCPT